MFQGHLDTIPMSSNAAQAILHNIYVKSSMGPDNIHPFVLKHCASELEVSFSIIFSKPLEEGSLPSTWKMLLVKLICKMGPHYSLD